MSLRTCLFALFGTAGAFLVVPAMVYTNMVLMVVCFGATADRLVVAGSILLVIPEILILWVFAVMYMLCAVACSE